jgi:glycosyltransferase involved in cell wall biosynthesis
MIRKQDVVFVYEEATRVGPPIIEWLVSKLRVPLVYDFCDPIFLPYKSPSNGHLSRLKFFGKYARICRMSTHVLAGNEPLAEFARRYNPAVSVVPITIDTDQYTQRKPPDRNRVPVIGWSGSSTTVPHLESIAEALRRLSNSERFHLKVVGTTPPTRLNEVPMSFVPWRSETEVAELQDMDIGIMPLPDDPWTRLRTQLKVRQYMGVGVPAVASPVGLLPELIEDGENGFLAATTDDWLDRLSRLIREPELREHVGQQGRATIEKQYSAKVWAPRVAEILRQAACGRA